MRLVVPDPGGHCLHRPRHRRARIGPERPDPRHRLRPCRAKARAQPGQVRPLGQRVKDHDPFRIHIVFCRHFQRARGGHVAIDLGITFVRKHDEIVLFGQFEQPVPIDFIRNGPLRVGGRTDIGDRGAVQNLGRESREIRQVPRRLGGVDINGLGPDRECRHRIDLIERVWRQDHGPLAALCLGTKRHGDVVKPFARAVERHDPLGPHLDAVAPVQPARNRIQKCGRAVVVGVIAKGGHRLGHRLGQEIGHRVLRAADGHVDDLAARRDSVQQATQSGPRRNRKVRKPLRGIHICLNGGIVSPRFASRLDRSAGGCPERRAAASGRRDGIVSFRPAPLRPPRPAATAPPRHPIGHSEAGRRTVFRWAR